MPEVINGVTIEAVATATNPVARRNIETIITFFSTYLEDKARFYSLWVEDEPKVITPFVTGSVSVCAVAVHNGWTAVRAFWDPIFDDMKGSFDWFIDEIIVGEDQDTIVTKSHSKVNVVGGASWGNKVLEYEGRYVQIFKFCDGKVQSFEEYYDTALLNAVYGG